MKIRIKANSIRLRLTKQEVGSLYDLGYLEEHTAFPTNTFIYAIQRVDEGTDLAATYESNKITVFVPATLMADWPTNMVTGFSSTMILTGTDTLNILVEKDFVCLEGSSEDQSDNYENPNKSC